MAPRKARHFEVGLAECGALADVVDEFEGLRAGSTAQVPVEDDEPELLFTLETPGDPSVDLATLAPDDPVDRTIKVRSGEAGE